jgi:hypothetical protein
MEWECKLHVGIVVYALLLVYLSDVWCVKAGMTFAVQVLHVFVCLSACVALQVDPGGTSNHQHLPGRIQPLQEATAAAAVTVAAAAAVTVAAAAAVTVAAPAAAAGDSSRSHSIGSCVLAAVTT